MSLENRSNSAMFKRAEQLKRWEESATNLQQVEPKLSSRKIQFSSGCVFLAACAASDKEEVLRLVDDGADIDTANVDGLTALHQACIDDNLDMVEFLVAHGADVNRGDNEGWTPLHATASCGFVSIAKYLIENGADVAAVNNDGELALDIAESDALDDILQEVIDSQGIDCDEARNREERMLLEDVKEWLTGDEDCVNPMAPHPKTGATALHVAAAKGYIKVMSLLLQGHCDIDIQDHDGWTPLHAAAHWGQKEAAQLLVEHWCEMTVKNYVGQAPLDVADPEMVKTLEDLRTKQVTLKKNKPPPNNLTNKAVQRPDRPNLIKDMKQEPGLGVKKVEVEIQPAQAEQEEGSTSPEDSRSQIEKKNRANKEDTMRIDTEKPSKGAEVAQPASEEGEAPQAWRRPSSLRGRNASDSQPLKNLSLHIEPKENATGPISNPPSEVVLRRTHSFEADEKFYRRYLELQARIASSCPALHPSGAPVPLRLPTRSASLRERHPPAVPAAPPVRGIEEETARNSLEPQAGQAGSAGSVTTPTSRTVPSPTQVTQPPVRRSFVPPVRDEESETQRKAHAKRVRETRRSTQGVTLEEIKSAEQLVKKKNQQGNSAGEEFLLEDARNKIPSGDVSSAGAALARRNPESEEASVTVALRRSPKEGEKEDKENDSRGALATQAVIQRRRKPKRRSTGVVHVDMDEIDPDRHDTGDTGGAGGGGDHSDSRKLNNNNNIESEDRSGRSSRLSSVSSTGAGDSSPGQPSEAVENGTIDYKKLYEEMQAQNERLKDKLKKTEEELLDARNIVEKSVNTNKSSSSTTSSSSSLSEKEKRERRAMERKLSEMEEELKLLEALKSENQRLKDENGALIRVISKLSK